MLLDLGTPRERPVHVLSSHQAEQYMAQGQFPDGSMGPKVAAALRFLRDGGERAVITSADCLADVVAGGDAASGHASSRSPVAVGERRRDCPRPARAPGAYLDSLLLMSATVTMEECAGVEWAGAVMATPRGLEELARAGSRVDG